DGAAGSGEDGAVGPGEDGAVGPGGGGGVGLGGGTGDRGGRLLGLLAEVPEEPDFGRGYLELLGGDGPEPSGLAQRLMHTGFVPLVYERWWRPGLFRILKGPAGLSVPAEHRLARDWLALSPGDTVLDVACGPGNFTRGMARAAGRTGLAVGLDASATMLVRAVADARAAAERGTAVPVYVRADAAGLPFRPASFDAVCCFAALPMFATPMRALDRMTEVLRPGGRIALMASYGRGGVALHTAERAAGRVLGMRIFGPEEITGALRVRGYTAIKQHVAGLLQFVGAVKAQ
ncbi:MAG TPA: methyltransferase domain-containing protein, partial [Streptosporangiaceae bacterium]|nr:methyltransferase domain-containing protein [Streptosporangiaceae bacterium]